MILFCMVPTSPTDEYWYRFSDLRYAGPVDELGDACGPGTTAVRLHRYPVLSRTPKGAWLGGTGALPGRRHVRVDTRKRFACPTVEEARESFLERKRRQIRILSAQRSQAEEAMRIVELGRHERPWFEVED